MTTKAQKETRAELDARRYGNVMLRLAAFERVEYKHTDEVGWIALGFSVSRREAEKMVTAARAWAKKAAQQPPVASLRVGAPIYVLLEEIEVGSENGETCWVLSAHTTEAGAEKARQDWRRDHSLERTVHAIECDLGENCTGRLGCKPGDGCQASVEEDEEWCHACQHGAFINVVLLEE